MDISDLLIWLQSEQFLTKHVPNTFKVVMKRASVLAAVAAFIIF
ncbi:hypothetical protein [Paenibacillus sp. 1P07SE]